MSQSIVPSNNRKQAEYDHASGPYQLFYTTPEAADYLGLKKSTLDCWRVRGRGPRFRKFGASVRYHRDDLDSFVAESERRSTSDTGQQ